jgi:hypothetical protein
MTRRIVALSLAGLLLAACGGAASPASLGPTASALAAVGPTAEPANSSGSSLKDAAAEYLAFVTGWNLKLEPIDAAFDAAGNDPSKLGEAWARYVALDEEFVRGLESISWPAEVQPVVDQFISDYRPVIAAERALAGDPLNKSLGAQLDAANALTRADAVKLRQVLGLPPLVASATTAPTAGVGSEPTRYKAGDVITISENGTDVGTVTIDKVSIDPSFEGGFSADRPATPGNVFLSAHLIYKALENGFNYNPFDWQVFVDGLAVDRNAFVLNGPEPTLSSGSLPKGRKAAGWIVYEVPKNGEVLLSYGSTFNFTGAPPPFEVVLRKS